MVKVTKETLAAKEIISQSIDWQEALEKTKELCPNMDEKEIDKLISTYFFIEQGEHKK